METALCVLCCSNKRLSPSSSSVSAVNSKDKEKLPLETGFILVPLKDNDGVNGVEDTSSPSSSSPSYSWGSTFSTELPSSIFCVRCSSLMTTAVTSKMEVEKREKTVRRRQLELLKELRNLEQELDNFKRCMSQMEEVVNKKVKKSCPPPPRLGLFSGVPITNESEFIGLRKQVLKVVTDLEILYHQVQLHQGSKLPAKKTPTVSLSKPDLLKTPITPKVKTEVISHDDDLALNIFQDNDDDFQDSHSFEKSSTNILSTRTRSRRQRQVASKSKTPTPRKLTIDSTDEEDEDIDDDNANDSDYIPDFIPTENKDNSKDKDNLQEPEEGSPATRTEGTRTNRRKDPPPSPPPLKRKVGRPPLGPKKKHRKYIPRGRRVGRPKSTEIFTPFICDICGKPFPHYRSKYNYKLHKWSHKSVEEKEECKRLAASGTLPSKDQLLYWPHTCPTCGKELSTSNALRRHQDQHDPNRQRILCPLCGRSFSTMTFRNHKRACVPPGETPKLDRKPVNCHLCERQFVQRSHLLDHLNVTHYGSQAYKCQLCPKSYGTKRRLKEHMDRHNNQEKFYCSKGCGHCLIDKYNITLHEAKCDGTGVKKIFNCELCGFEAKSEAGYSLHLTNRHGGPRKSKKQFLCQHCPKVFVTKKSFERHLEAIAKEEGPHGRHSEAVSEKTDLIGPLQTKQEPSSSYHQVTSYFNN